MIDFEIRNQSNYNFYELGLGNETVDAISLDTCMACYFEKDINSVMTFMNLKFVNAFKISYMPIRFFRNFIDSQSNLYTNKFERYITGKDIGLIDFDEFNYSMEWIEKYYHILRESILYIESTDKFTSIDASNYRELDVDDYLIRSDKTYYRVNTTGVYERNYIKNVDNSFGFEDILLHETNGICPIVKFREYGIECPQINTLVLLEYNAISDISWGVFNASPKLLTQPVVQSDQPDDVIREGSSGFGRTSRMLKVGSGENISTVDMGDLQNLLDLKKMYGDLITEQAIRHGIDSYSVSMNPLASISSGESKKVELTYVNQYRKKYFRMFNKFEKQVFDIMSKLFNLAITFEKIEFYDIEYGFLTPASNVGVTINNTKEVQSKVDTQVETEDDTEGDVEVNSELNNENI